MAFVKNRGFTIVEALVALFILMIVVLGLLYTLNLSINVNMQNAIRNQAIRIVQSQTDELINNASNGSPIETAFTKTLNIPINNFTQTYTVSVTPTAQSQDEVILYTITVSWIYKGQSYYHTQTTAVHL